MKFNKLQFYGVSVVITTFAFFSIYLLEYFTGNGDGIWHDFDVLKVAFMVLLLECFVFLVCYDISKWKPLFPNIVLSFFTIIITLFLVEFSLGLLIKMNASKPQTILQKNFH